MGRLIALHVGGSCEPWQSLGLVFENDSCLLANVALEVTGQTPGLCGWVIEAGRNEHTFIDGISTHIVSEPVARADDSLIGTQRITHLDHVVINTDNLDRTCASIDEVLGAEMRREREVGNGVFQRFHKLDNTIIEVVSGPHITTPGASLWGMVISVDDLFECADQLGDTVVSPPKRATQPGRFISTVRGSVGLGVPFAMMTPHVSGMATH